MKRLRPLFLSMFLLIALTAVVLVINGAGLLSKPDPVLDGITALYGEAASRLVSPEIISTAPLRPGIFADWQIKALKKGDPEKLNIYAVLPDNRDYLSVMQGCRPGTVLIETSAVDAWHRTANGWKWWQALRSKTLRVVVFDGGHHLPTLALQPDLLLVPEWGGCAAHGYMRDAMPVENIIGIIRVEKLNCTVARVPRWGLVKSQGALERATLRVLKDLPVGKEPPRDAGEVLASCCTRCRDAAFVYWEKPGIDPGFIINRLKGSGVKRVYLAFNYGEVAGGEVQKILRALDRAGLKVRVVNQPDNVTTLTAREVKRCITGHRP